MHRSVNIEQTELIVRRSICYQRGGTKMKRLLITGLAGCAFVLAPTISAPAMPAATPYALGGIDQTVIQVKGGHGHGWGHHGGRGHHYGWYRGHHYGWRHHRHWW